eukprot:g4618.t1
MVGEVVQSNNEKFAVGDLVTGGFGWQSHALSNGRGLAKLDASMFQGPLRVTAAIGVLGIPGLTSYFGLQDLGQPKEGETVLISSAAGPVGATAGQIAKMKGCRTIGIAGSKEKCAYVTGELGFDACINYKEVANLEDAIKGACPDGVDIYFDNVGGEMLDAAIANTNERARIIISGAVSEYNKAEPRGIRNTLRFITHRLRMEGLVVFDYFKQFRDAQAEMGGWIMQGKLIYTEDISEAQIVGPEGKVIGVDVNDDMLELSRSALPTVAEQLGYDNIEFRHGRIQDLKTDMDALDHWLSARPAKSAADYKDLEAHLAKSRQTHPLIADNSIDVVVSNCVLNLVSDDEKPQLFQEIFRVLKPGGRIAISDIVSDKDSPEHLKDDPDLWSGCISGALTEKGFADALSQAGFSGVQLDKLEQTPWQVVEEIEYRSATYVAHKPLDTVANDEEIEVIYAGPWEQVRDETGLTYERGARSKVSGAEASRLRSGAYAGHFVIFGEEDTDNSCC